MVTWVVYIAVGLIIGGAAGFFLGRLDDFSKKEKQAMQDKLKQARQELVDYKHEVTEHFVATAGLVNNLTESYQAVHEHLAKGAQSLCDHQVAVNRLEVTRPVVIEDLSSKAAGIESELPETAPAKESMASHGPQAATGAAPMTEDETGETTTAAAIGLAQEGEKPAEANSEQIAAPEEAAQARPGDTSTAAGDKAGVSDQNELTMASRMVH